MSRATLMYIVMLAAGAGGLWAILRAGAGLAAPTDLSGAWVVGGEDPRAPLDLGNSMFVEQSGRYLRLNFERGLELDVKILTETRPDPAKGDRLEVRMAGGPWTVTVVGDDAAGPLMFRVAGPEPHAFTVSRQSAGGPGAEAGEHASAAAVPAGAAAAPAPSNGPTADAGSHAP